MSQPEVTGTAMERIWRSLSRLHARVEERLESRLQAAHGLSLSEFRVLRRLADAPDRRLRMRDVADEAGLSQSAASRLVARLEDDRGVVERCSCPHDRRGVFTELSEEGAALLREAEETHEETLRSAWREAGGGRELRTALEAVGGDAG